MKKTSKQKSVKANASVKERMIRFTADLPESLHRQFSIWAAKEGKDKVVLFREWLEEKLKDMD